MNSLCWTHTIIDVNRDTKSVKIGQTRHSNNNTCGVLVYWEKTFVVTKIIKIKIISHDKSL